MQLEQYLKVTMREGETQDARWARFGKRIDVSLHCVRKWIYGQRRIPDPMKLRIRDITEGEVTLEDMVRG